MNIKFTKAMFLALSLLLLSSCGGGDDESEDVASEGGGISGTGITSIGVITGFGSIYINGIRFDIDNAIFNRDGKASIGQSEFSVGEYIVIKGMLNADKKTGVAQNVSFTDIVEGQVTAISNNSIDVLGQKILINKDTVFHGFKQLTELSQGNILEVSGIKNSKGKSTATSIKLKQKQFDHNSENEVKGTISQLNKAQKIFKINLITVDYAGATFKGMTLANLKNGQFVEVKSRSTLSGTTLIANEVELEDENHEINDAKGKLELQGLVTRFVSITDFDVNNQKITTYSKTKYKHGKPSDITLNALIEVEGKINSAGVLVADEVSFDD
jgi:hypothetical protein